MRIALTILILAVVRIATAQTLHGLNFGPYLNGQSPGSGIPVTPQQIQSRLQIIAPHTRWIRSFGMTNGLEHIPAAARALSKNVAAAAWIDGNLAGNELELANLIAAANAGRVDIAVVGTEVLLFNRVSEGELLNYMNRVRTSIPSNIPVTTAETYGELLQHPNVIAASDVVLGNFYPYWEGISVNNAVCALASQYQTLVTAAGGKPVVVAETGWPSAGTSQGAAVPSPANAARFFGEFVSWANGSSIPYFYFEAFDEAWKAVEEGSQGPHWGLWDSDGVLKLGMHAILNGQLPVITCGDVIGGPGTPALTFVWVPPYGNSADYLQGRALHVRPGDYRVVVYIRAAGGWWIKPYYEHPLTTIRSDGFWTTNIVTGGSDHIATEIAAFLIPASYSPPLLLGSPSLPPDLLVNSVASAQTMRSVGSLSGTVLNGPPGVIIDAGIAGTAASGPDGRYSFPVLPASGQLVVRASAPGFTFAPASVLLSITGGPQTVNFAATASTADPVAIFRDANGRMAAVTYSPQGPAVTAGGGPLASEPAVSQDSGGNTHVVARDTFNGLWLTAFRSSTRDWSAWRPLGGVTVGQPDIAASTSGDVYVAARDSGNGYYLVTAPAGGQSVQWKYLGGVLASDPTISVGTQGYVSIAGRDLFGAVWLCRYRIADGLFEWNFLGGVTMGRPVIREGPDQVVYVVVRDTFGSPWKAPVVGAGIPNWSWGQGVSAVDPQLTFDGAGQYWVLIRDTLGTPYVRNFAPGTAGGWGTYVYPGGSLPNGSSIAGSNGEFYLTGRGSDGRLYWYRSSIHAWRDAGIGAQSGGAPSAAPR